MINPDNDYFNIVNVNSGNVVTKIVISVKNNINKTILMVLPLNNGDIMFTTKRNIC